jgi:hypothetical protein
MSTFEVGHIVRIGINRYVVVGGDENYIDVTRISSGSNPLSDSFTFYGQPAYLFTLEESGEEAQPREEIPLKVTFSSWMKKVAPR